MIGKIEKTPQMDMFQTPLIHFINKQQIVDTDKLG